MATIARKDTSAPVYEDKRLTEVKAEEKAALSNIDKTYSGMLQNSDAFYGNQAHAIESAADQQAQLQQEQTDFTIEKIEQQKARAEKDYTQEQSGAYADWQEQSNEYGVNAEKMAAAGLQNTGYSETAQVSMYTAYQNRVAVAKASYDNAVLEYNNMITEAKMQNSAALAEIAYNTLQQKLAFALEGFQYKNQLILDQTNKKLEIGSEYYNRRQDVQNQINTENSLLEERRQFNENISLQRKELEEQIRQFDAEMARLKENDSKENEALWAELQLARDELQFKRDQLAEEIRQFNSGASGGTTNNYAPITGDDRPNTIEGHGAVSATEDTVKVGGKKYTAYEAADGTIWYWDSDKKEYIKVHWEG